MMVWGTLVRRWSGFGHAVENARTASSELSRLRLEREAVALYLEEVRQVHGTDRHDAPLVATS
jgi:hypothetical protein